MHSRQRLVVSVAQYFNLVLCVLLLLLLLLSLLSLLLLLMSRVLLLVLMLAYCQTLLYTLLNLNRRPSIS